MSSVAAAPSRDLTRGLRVPEVSLRPAEGWVTVGLLVLMGLLVAWAVDDAGWVLGRSQLTDFLTWPVLGGMAVGLVGAKVGWGRWTTHLIGALLAALIVPIIVGSVLTPDGGSIGIYFQATSDAVVEAWLDLFIRGQTVTRQYGHFLLVLALLLWGTGQFA